MEIDAYKTHTFLTVLSIYSNMVLYNIVSNKSYLLITSMKFNAYFSEFLFLKVKSVCSFRWLKQSKQIQHFDYSYMFNMLCKTPSFT